MQPTNLLEPADYFGLGAQVRQKVRNVYFYIYHFCFCCCCC